MADHIKAVIRASKNQNVFHHERKLLAWCVEEITALRSALDGEREMCAKEADDDVAMSEVALSRHNAARDEYASTIASGSLAAGRRIAAAIRARSKTGGEDGPPDA